MDLAAELGASDLRAVGRPRGRRGRRRQGHAGRAGPLPRGHRHRSPQYVDRPRLRPALRHRAQAERAARRHPAAHDRARPRASSRPSSTPTWSASTPRSATSRWPSLNFTHGIAQALWQGKLFHIDLNGQRGPQVRPGPGLRPRRPAAAPSPSSTCSRTAVPTAARLRRPAPLRLQAAAHRGHRRRVGVGRGQHAHLPAAQGAGRGLPRRPRGAGGAGRRPGARAGPARRWATGETYDDLLADRSAFEDFDADAAGATGFGFVRLDQLAIEHLLGAR